MICNHCGKEVETVTSVIAELHNQGKTPREISEELQSSGRLQGIRTSGMRYVHSFLSQMGLKANKKPSIP